MNPQHNSTKVISRYHAELRGLTRYFTGLPCKRGHVSERSICNCHCVECARADDKAYRRRLRPPRRIEARDPPATQEAPHGK